MNDHDMPPKLLTALTKLWQVETPMTLAILPRDAWVTLGVIQFATRNPALNTRQRAIIETVGRQLQQVLQDIDPVFAKYLELGWDPANDVARED